MEGWRMPVPSGMSEQRTWSSVVREVETQLFVSFIIYMLLSLFQPNAEVCLADFNPMKIGCGQSLRPWRTAAPTSCGRLNCFGRGN